jgi:hypothetical protein
LAVVSRPSSPSTITSVNVPPISNPTRIKIYSNYSRLYKAGDLNRAFNSKALAVKFNAFDLV